MVLQDKHMNYLSIFNVCVWKCIPLSFKFGVLDTKTQKPMFYLSKTMTFARTHSFYNVFAMFFSKKYFFAIFPDPPPINVKMFFFFKIFVYEFGGGGLPHNQIRICTFNTFFYVFAPYPPPN